ncbi:MAG: hypothetical protein H7123_03210, partial [Thermoleophilia bacterium]|nr:hypothetical protein [Thermoleophilia bacterium]
ATSLSLTGADGATDFVIRPADRAAFDVSHLREHQSEGAPITVYFELRGGAKLALAYEDA